MRAADVNVVPEAAPAAVLHALVDAVDWVALDGACGPATEVPGLLGTIISSASRLPAAAWDDLCGDVLHQGSVSPATAPVIPVMAGIAAWRDHPSRIEAIRFLREVAIAESSAALHTRTIAASEPLVANWLDEPPPIRRALLLLLTTFPDELLVAHVALSDEELPTEHCEAFVILTSGGPRTQADFELVCDFVDWAMDV
jgi:hypothetical protein